MAEFLWTLVIYPLYELIEIAFKLFYRFFKNPGMATIGVSVAVTLLCLPLYIVAERWQEAERKIQEKLKPGIARIKKAFKGDEQYMILTAFYRQNHYHPMMALRSSFSLLIQVPFFMAAYSYLSNLELLKSSSFLFIKNLGLPDALFSIGNFNINILPIAMTLINCVAGAIYAQGHGAREKIQIYAMAAIFLVILYNSPAGLVLYWTMNNVLSLVKNIFYKFKRPMKALYILLAACVAAALAYLFFVHQGSTNKRIYTSLALICLLAAPLFVKSAQFLLRTSLDKILDDKKTRFFIFGLSALGLCLSAGLLIPSSLIQSSVQEFSDIGGTRSPLFFTANSLFQAAGLFLLWPLCLYFLFSKKIQALLALAFAAAFFGSLANAFAFAGDYGSMNSSMTFLDGFKQMKAWMILLNAALLAAIAAATLLALKKRPKAVQSLAGIASCAALALSAATIAKISSEYQAYEKNVAQGAAKADAVRPFFEFSKSGKNVLVIMLDRAEGAYVQTIFDERGDLKDKFSGFVFYKNTVSYNGHTLLGAPAIFGGYEYTPDQMNKRQDATNLQKSNEALLLLPRLFTEQAGFSAASADMPWANFSYIPDLSIASSFPKIKAQNTMRRYTDYWKTQNADKIDEKTSLLDKLKRDLLWFSAFRLSPAFARGLIYDGAQWWSVKSSQDLSYLDSYSTLDLLPKLTKINDKGNFYNSFANELTHEDMLLQPPKYEPQKKLDLSAYTIEDLAELSAGAKANEIPPLFLPGFSGNAASYILLSKWFDYLKANGVYDNTRIIIVSDHGIGIGAQGIFGFDKPLLSNGYPKDHFHAVLFEKDFGASGPIVFDEESFMTTADVPTMAAAGIIESPTNPWTGAKINSALKDKGAKVTCSNRHQPGYHIHPNHFTIDDDEWYTVKENIFKDENWTKGAAE